VRQRPAGVVNARLWEFPNAEVTLAETDYRKNARAALGFAPVTVKPLGSLKHTITRYRITVDVFGAELRNGATCEPVDGQWCNSTQLSSLAFASAHGKILRRFAGL
jgi:adenine-specific DNA glycosylase